jgi:transcriptional regulator with XRE-family HTH domain
MLNQAIKNFLEERGIKQSFLKKHLGISTSTVNAMLNGNRGISAEEYFKICTALKVPLDYFANAAATADETNGNSESN